MRHVMMITNKVAIHIAIVNEPIAVGLLNCSHFLAASLMSHLGWVSQVALLKTIVLLILDF
jgi:hypothetical protein